MALAPHGERPRARFLVFFFKRTFQVNGVGQQRHDSQATALAATDTKPRSVRSACRNGLLYSSPPWISDLIVWLHSTTECNSYLPISMNYVCRDRNNMCVSLKVSTYVWVVVIRTHIFIFYTRYLNFTNGKVRVKIYFLNLKSLLC